MTSSQLIKRTLPGRLHGEQPEIMLDETGNLGGIVEYDSKTGRLLRIGVPARATAEGRTIRCHESDHIRYSARGVREWVILHGDRPTEMEFHCVNFFEDVRISQPIVWRDRPKQVKRDAAAVALRDLRKALRKLSEPTIASTPDIYNGAMGIAMRSIALACAVDAGADGRFDGLTSRHLTGKVCEKRSALEQTVKALKSIVQTIWKARLPDRPAYGFRENDVTRSMRPILRRALGLWSAMQMKPLSDPDEHPGRCVYQEPEETGESGGTSDRYKVIRLPMAVDTLAHQRNIVRYPAACGPRLRSGSLVQLALGIPGLHFIRRTIKESPNGAAVMIDGSGSMSIEQSDLEELSAQMPAGFIAYYCASREEEGGEITIYADNGRRALSMPDRCGTGNFIDYPAVRMLLARPEAPKILVSDLGFCGGPNDEIVLAKLLVERERAAGRLIVIRNLTQAIEYLSAPKIGGDR